MIVEYIQPILYVTGGITATTILQFLFPKLQARILKLDLPTHESRFFFAHWGLVVFGIGILLIMAASNEALRIPVLIAATIEKMGLIGMLLINRKQPFTKAMLPALLFDVLCVILYCWYLLTIY